MKIAILGTGAMGGVYGYKLYQGGYDVTFIDIWKEHVEAMKANGLKVDGLGGEAHFKAKCTDKSEEVGPVDLVIILVKAYDTLSAIKGALPLIGPETMVVSLQNGVGNIEKLASVIDPKHIIGGVTSHSAFMVAPGNNHHAAASYTSIGELDGSISERIKKVADIFEKSGLIPVVISDNVTGLIWKKLMGNISINAICALTHIRNGQILDFEEMAEVSRLAVMETAAVARAKGIVMDYDPWETARKVMIDTVNGRASMLQDVMAKRRTEIDVINGAVVQEGKTLGIPTPVNQTLTALVSVIQQTYNAS